MHTQKQLSNSKQAEWLKPWLEQWNAYLAYRTRNYTTKWHRKTQLLVVIFGLLFLIFSGIICYGIKSKSKSYPNTAVQRKTPSLIHRPDSLVLLEHIYQSYKK